MAIKLFAVRNGKRQEIAVGRTVREARHTRAIDGMIRTALAAMSVDVADARGETGSREDNSEALGFAVARLGSWS